MSRAKLEHSICLFYPVIKNMIGVINEVYLFFNLSSKRQNYFEHILEAFDSRHGTTKIKRLCKTRWEERYTCFETFYDLYMLICSCFEAIVDPNVYSDMNIETN